MEFAGFYNLTVEQRRKMASEFAKLSADEQKTIASDSALPLGTASRMIENVIGTYQIPLGLATNFVINGRDVLVPMAIEEPSVVAAASNGAKMAKESGGFVVSSTDPVMIGEISIVRMQDAQAGFDQLQKNKPKLIQIASKYAQGIEKYGGGVKGCDVEMFDSAMGKMLLLKYYIDVRDAMGANTVNTILELSAPEVEKMAGGQSRMRILSNLATKRIARASAKWKKEALGADNVEKILEGYELAVCDPFRCATHNKGIMNGIDAVAVACGQDWRAIEAGCHAYAAMGGRYRPLTKYYKDKNGDLVGEIEIPVPVGIVGGATKTHPMAQVCLKFLGVKTAQELGEIMAAVGLAQNFAALRAITMEGIQKGHMRLHAKNIAIAAGATGEDIDRVASLMASQGSISISAAQDILLGKKGGDEKIENGEMPSGKKPKAKRKN